MTFSTIMIILAGVAVAYVGLKNVLAGFKKLPEVIQEHAEYKRAKTEAKSEPIGAVNAPVRGEYGEPYCSEQVPLRLV